MTDKDILDKILNDFTTAKNHSKDAHDRIANYRSYHNDVKTQNDLTPNKSKSTYRSKVIAKELNKVAASISESILDDDRLFLVNSSSGTSKEKTELANHQWCNVLNRDKVVNDSTQHYLIDGTAIFKTGWKVEIDDVIESVDEFTYTSTPEEAEEIISRYEGEKKESLIKLYNVDGRIPTGKVEKEKIKRVTTNSIPTIKVVDPVTVFVPPVKSSDDLEYIIEKYTMTYADMFSTDNGFKNKDYILQLLKRDAGLNDLYDEMDYETLDQSIESTANYLMGATDGLASKKITVYEYWGYVDTPSGSRKLYVANWIDNVLIRYIESPYRHNKIPYTFAQSNPSVDSIFGVADSHFVVEDQSGLSRVMRVLDNSSINSQNDQTLFREGFFTSEIEKNNYKKGRDAYFNRKYNISDSIHKNSVEPLPNSVDYLREVHKSEVTSFLSISPEQNGMVNIENQVIDREMSKIRTLSKAIADSLSLVLDMDAQFLLIGDKILINNKKELEITKFLLTSKIESVKATATTRKFRTRMANEIIELMNTRAANMTELVAAQHYMALAKINGNYDLYDEIEKEVERLKNPKPTPQEELELKKMELEAKRLEAETARYNAEAEMFRLRGEEHRAKAIERLDIFRSGIRSAEAENERSKAEFNDVHADKLRAQTSLFNQEFDLIDSGEKREEAELLAEFQHAANMEREEARTKRELEAKAQKGSQDKVSNDFEEARPNKERLLEYILEGTLNNESYDAAEDVYRNILSKNKLDLEQNI